MAKLSRRRMGSDVVRARAVQPPPTPTRRQQKIERRKTQALLEWLGRARTEEEAQKAQEDRQKPVPAKNANPSGNRKARLTQKAHARRAAKQVRPTKLSEADLKAFQEMPQQFRSAIMQVASALEAVTGRAVDSLREIDDVA